MRQNLRSGLGRVSTENLLHRPEARVVEPFSKRNDIGCSQMLVLLSPRTAGQLIWLNGRKHWKVQQCNLSGQFLWRHSQRTAEDRVQVGQVCIGWQAVGLLGGAT